MIAVPHLKICLYCILLIAVSLSAAEPDPMEFKESAYLSANTLVMMVLQENPGSAELIAAAEAA